MSTVFKAKDKIKSGSVDDDSINDERMIKALKEPVNSRTGIFA